MSSGAVNLYKLLLCLLVYSEFLPPLDEAVQFVFSLPIIQLINAFEFINVIYKILSKFKNNYITATHLINPFFSGEMFRRIFLSRQLSSWVSETLEF